MGARLAVFPDEAVFSEFAAAAGSKGWLGATSLVSETDWLWDDGSDVSFTSKWNVNEVGPGAS